MDQLRYDIDRDHGEVRVRMTGVLDLGSRPTFAELAREILSGSASVVVDLADLEFLDSTGIVELIRTARRAEERGVRLRFVGPRGGAARRTADVVGLGQILAWDDDGNVDGPDTPRVG
jgi:anti-sigma B factor antagonist